MKTYTVEFWGFDLARVEIDPVSAAEPIREMVRFWSGHDGRLEEAGGDYTRAWLIQLGEFVLTHHRVPRDDEGWAPLDGSCGIKLLSWERFEHDREDFEIREEPLA